MLKKHFLLLSIPLKTIELLNVLVETMTRFQDFLVNRKFNSILFK